MPSMSSRARVVTSTPKCFPLIRTVEVGGVLADLELDTGSEELRGDQLGACLQKFRERLLPAGPVPVLAELLPPVRQLSGAAGGTRRSATYIPFGTPQA
jgi:hypothetical protein